MLTSPALLNCTFKKASVFLSEAAEKETEKKKKIYLPLEEGCNKIVRVLYKDYRKSELKRNVLHETKEC